MSDRHSNGSTAARPATTPGIVRSDGATGPSSPKQRAAREETRDADASGSGSGSSGVELPIFLDVDVADGVVVAVAVLSLPS